MYTEQKKMLIDFQSKVHTEHENISLEMTLDRDTFSVCLIDNALPCDKRIIFSQYGKFYGRAGVMIEHIKVELEAL
jgi:hypothetical protein